MAPAEEPAALLHDAHQPPEQVTASAFDGVVSKYLTQYLTHVSQPREQVTASAPDTVCSCCNVAIMVLQSIGLLVSSVANVPH